MIGTPGLVAPPAVDGRTEWNQKVYPKLIAALFFDTHTHLTAEDFDHDRGDVIQRALDAGVERMVAIGYDLESSKAAVTLADSCDSVFAAAGIHPCHVHEASEADYREVEKLLEHPSVVGVGETGVDLYHDRSTYPLQRDSFRRHMEWGRSTGLPVIVHDRDAHAEVMAVLDEFQGQGPTAILHCFTGDAAMAERAVSMGCFLGFGGIATFKNSTVPEVVARLPEDRILIETDAPYLAPVPHRGRRNEPSYLVNTAEAVARHRSVTVDELARTTTLNAKKVFRIH